MANTTQSTTHAAIFDLDGTLIDAFADIAAAVNYGLEKHNLPTHSVETVRGFVGNGVTKLIDRAAPEQTEDEKDAIMGDLLEYYREHPADRAHVYDGVFPMLEDLRRRGFKLAILSNKPHQITLKTCETLGLTPYFDDIVGEHPENSPRKPDTKGLVEQLKRLACERPFLAGDGVPDGVVAQSVGIPFAACLWGTRSREELEPYAPYCFAADPAELHAETLKYLGL